MRQPTIERMATGLIQMVAVPIQTGTAATANGHCLRERGGMNRCLAIAQTVQIAQTGQLVVAARTRTHVIGARARRMVWAEAVLDAGAHTATLVQCVAELAPELACSRDDGK